MAGDKTFQLFVGNLSQSMKSRDLIRLFRKYGSVDSCKVMKNYAFVYMKNEKDANTAIRKVNGYKLHGRNIVVHAANTTIRKLFVGDLADNTHSSEVRRLFEKYGIVVECDIVRNYGFVHLQFGGNIYDLINKLNGVVINRKAIKVQLSRSNLRPGPGMGNREQCYTCGKEGHWSVHCPNRHGPPLPPPPPPQQHQQQQPQSPLLSTPQSRMNENRSIWSDSMQPPADKDWCAPPPPPAQPPVRHVNSYNNDVGRYAYMSPGNKLPLLPPPPSLLPSPSMPYYDNNDYYYSDDRGFYECRSRWSETLPPPDRDWCAPPPPNRDWCAPTPPPLLPPKRQVKSHNKDVGRYTYISPEHKQYLRTGPGKRYAPY